MVSTVLPSALTVTISLWSAIPLPSMSRAAEELRRSALTVVMVRPRSEPLAL
jgi:hypothetical protein